MKSNITKLLQLSTFFLLGTAAQNTNAELVLMKACYHNDQFFAEISRNGSCVNTHNNLPPHNVNRTLTQNSKTVNSLSLKMPPVLKVETHLCEIKEKNTRYLED